MKHIVGIAWFRAGQWNRLLELSSDREQMEADYEEWRANAEEQMAGLRAQGLDVRKIDIDLDEFAAWCKSKKVPVNADSRSRYAAYKVRLDDSKN